MRYYELALTGIALTPLTYESVQELYIGGVCEVFLRGKSIRAVVLKEVQKPSFTCSEAIATENLYLPQSTLEIANFISNYYFCSMGEALGLFEPFRGESNEKFDTKFDISVELSQEQNEAFEFLRTKRVGLLFGATGSGKTEVYMKMAQEALNEGKTVIVLMPEISLTPQTQHRLEAHFKDSVAVWHSKQTAKKKREIMQKVHSGQIRIVAGPRSALFLPLKNIGLIVVDEEHDDAYKSSSRPRYNAKDLAIYMGGKLDAKVLLCSATPSLPSYAKFEHFRLKSSYFDTEKHFVFEDREPSLSDFIIDSLADSLKTDGAQAIVFLPTRANYKYLSCSSCRQNIQCPFCSVGMSLHSAARIVKCHYCGFAQAIPKACPSCGEPRMQAFRIGTAEVCDELSKRFPSKRIQKFDRDAITTDTKLRVVLSEFNEGKIDILVGTQMLSKGHDYHSIKLAVILGLDSILAQNDFRARERALTLLVQIAGRAGRNGVSKVVVQTCHKEFFMKYLSDYELFLKDELLNRKGLYPPDMRMARVLMADKNQDKAKAKMQAVLASLKQAADIDIVGFGEAGVAKIAGKYRYDILFRSRQPHSLLAAISSLEDVGFEIDMDPLSFS